ncbi:MAG: hypothetical protein ACI9CE_001734 [Flavobacterium sp.]|jgi:hypothetical protein
MALNLNSFRANGLVTTEAYMRAASSAAFQYFDYFDDIHNYCRGMRRVEDLAGSSTVFAARTK